MGGGSTVRFGEGVSVRVRPGTTLLEAARQAGMPIDAVCAGLRTCGRCRMRASGELSPPAEEEIAVLGEAAVADGWRLACRARVSGEVFVTVPRAEDPHAVQEGFVGPPWPPDPPSGIGGFGVAVDLGTTTVVCALVDCASGDVRATTSALNAQHPFGADVMSRVAAASRDGLAPLRQPLVEQVDALAREAVERANGDLEAVVRLVAVGNTAMRGLFLGHDVTPLGAAPYDGVPLGPVEADGKALGLRSLSRAAVYAPPCASAFVGADAVAGLVAARFLRDGPPRLFVDLGTNAEAVLWTGERLLAASAAAGPALEGAGLSSGMRAVTGAVEDVRFDGGTLALATIGDARPAGLCGSGALSLTAALLDAGAISEDGRLTGEAPPPARVVDREDQRVLLLGADGTLAFTQKDVRAVQLAKGAVQAAVGTLLAEAAVAPDAVAQVLVAGGFGRRLQAGTLVRLGVFPRAWSDRVRFVGNAALDGARAMLVSSAARAEAETLASAIEAVDLATHPAFRDAFIAALGFPAR